MSDPNLHSYIHAQEITLHIRISRKFKFLPQLRSVLGTEVLQAVLVSPISLILSMLSRSLVWEVYVFVLL